MRTPWRPLLWAAALPLVGCTQAALPGTGGLNGVGNITWVRVGGFDGGALVDAQYGQIAFMTSSNSDDLKGLDLILTDPTQTRNYVPAPNPLQPLSIPTVDQPIALAPSVRYGQIATQNLINFPLGSMGGQTRTGMLLFVRSSASNNISVVGAANVPESLRQLTNGLLQQSAGLVTAISARLTATEQNVVLYYATFDGQDATVWERVLQHPPTTSPSFSGPFPTSLTYVSDCSVPPPPLPSTTLYVCPQRPVRTYQNSSVSALQVLPTLPTDLPLPVLGGLEGGRLGVALRDLVPPLNNASLSNSGEVRIINPAVPADLDENGTSSDPYFRLARYYAPFTNPQPPLIPGAPLQPPVRALLTHPRAYNVYADGGAAPGPDGNPPVLAYEGARLFGVLDESSCYGSINCTGLIAIDALPNLTDGGPNANYGLLAFDGSDCIQTAADGVTVYCANEIGMTNRMLPLRMGLGVVQGEVGIQGVGTSVVPSGTGAGVIQGVAFESAVQFPNGTALTELLIPLLGVVTISAESLDHTTAQIFFFDAVGLRPINENFGPGITNGITLVIPSGITAAVDGGAGGAINFITANVGVGIYPYSESLNIINEGSIPGLTGIIGIPYDAGILPAGFDAGILPDAGTAQVFAWPVPDAGAATAVSAVQANDLLFPINLSGTLCVIGTGNDQINPSAVVLGVDDAGANILTGPLSSGSEEQVFTLADCPGASGYNIIAGPASAQPFLVTGSIQGLLGRMQAGPDDGGAPPIFQIPNAVTDALGLTYFRFYNPSVAPGVVIDPDGGVPTPALTLQLPPVDTPNNPFLQNAGAVYSFELSSGYLGASMPIDAVGLGFGGLFLPGGVTQSRIIDAAGEVVLDIVTYPSSQTVIDFNPAAIVPDTPNSGPVTVHF